MREEHEYEKKTLGVILTLAMCLSLVACGAKKGNDNVATNTNAGSLFEPIDDSTAAQDKNSEDQTSSLALPEGVEFNTADGWRRRRPGNCKQRRF